jgi:hypothetical protein
MRFGQRMSVVLRPDMQIGIKSLGYYFSEGRYIIQLGIRSIFVKNLLHARGIWQQGDKGPGFDSLFVDGQGKFFCQRVSLNEKLLGRFERQRVMHHDLGKFGNARVGHGESFL